MKKRTSALDIGNKITVRNSPDFLLGKQYDLFDEKIQVLREDILSRIGNTAKWLIISGCVFLSAPACFIYELFGNPNDRQLIILLAAVFTIPSVILFILAFKKSQAFKSIKNGEFIAYDFEITGKDTVTDEDRNVTYIIMFAENTGAVYADGDDYKKCRIGDTVCVYFIKDAENIFYCAYKLTVNDKI